ncbi:muconate cycloisomerase [Parapedobacter pyrenivorans]|uniref:Dipeptide epimerase n=1 Tax=Parapedobacter pyrenivorans TaxID=1305674 RepID=A0A917I2C6_9SPHI|nr:dipeptide epimerase [Parapedobacter pyrenivorans]GGH02632.1 muconate cycloisomerase [Parapedobacter pyrenivorans]
MTTQTTSRKSGKFTLRYRPYTLELKHTFTIASGSRSTTPIVLTELEFEGVTGYGEASMPPYLGESHESVLAFLDHVDLSGFADPFLTADILEYIDTIAQKNTAAKAALDIALHDLLGKIMHQPWHRIWGYNPADTPNTSFTIGIDTPDVVRQKVREAEPYKLLKVKLGLDTDKMMIDTIREVTDKPLCVDVNQGWKRRGEALEMAHWLADRGVLFLEQPMSKDQPDDNAWLTERSPIPTIGDEAVQRLDDVRKAFGVYHGINIKLMKCTGMREANQMAVLARALGMKVMLGCMTETSCAISAAAQLSPIADWADLDGALLTTNDIYRGMEVVNGKVALPARPGIGIISNQ